MIDHLGITVSDFEASKAFYDKAMAPLGASLLMMVPAEYTGGVKVGGYGRERPTSGCRRASEPKDHQHVAFTARSRAEVDAFYAAAIAAGGRTMAGRGCGRTIIRTTTAPSSSTPTATMSKPSATIRPSEGGRADEPRQHAASIRAAASAARCASMSRARSATPRSAIAACARRRAAISTSRWCRCAAPSSTWTRGEPKKLPVVEPCLARLLRRLRHAADLRGAGRHGAGDRRLRRSGRDRAGHPVGHRGEAALCRHDSGAARRGDDGRPGRGAASSPTLVSYQHPDYDTDQWPPEDRT